MLEMFDQKVWKLKQLLYIHFIRKNKIGMIKSIVTLKLNIKRI